MRNLIIAIIFLGFAGYVGAILYQRATADYPALVELESADGRVLSVTLLGRSATHIQFMRKDGQRFVYSLNLLSSGSRALVKRYPVTGLQRADRAEDVSLSKLHLDGMAEAMAALQEKRRLLGYELYATESKAQKQTVEERIEALGLEMRKLDLKMETFKSKLN